ncbi:hypothetical protein KCU79_g59, partial [Aureobasidium melanogenum]
MACQPIALSQFSVCRSSSNKLLETLNYLSTTTIIASFFFVIKEWSRINANVPPTYATTDAVCFVSALKTLPTHEVSTTRLSFQVVQRIESVVLPYFPTHCMVEEQMSRLSWSSFVAETITLA